MKTPVFFTCGEDFYAKNDKNTEFVCDFLVLSVYVEECDVNRRCFSSIIFLTLW